MFPFSKLIRTIDLETAQDRYQKYFYGTKERFFRVARYFGLPPGPFPYGSRENKQFSFMRSNSIHDFSVASSEEVENRNKQFTSWMNESDE